MPDNFDEAKLNIQEIVGRAQEVIQPLLKPVLDTIDEIKLQLVHGTDRIPTAIIQQWALSLSVSNSEISPHQEAYALASSLWKVEINNSNAKNIAERRAEQKKAEVENQNIIDSRDKDTQKIVIDYMSSMIKDTQENIRVILSELNRILDARAWNHENK